VSSGNEISDHDRGDGLAIVIFKLDVSICNNADELGSQCCLLC
jgi:hypothetical protein